MSGTLLAFSYEAWAAAHPELVTRATSAQVVALAAQVPLVLDLCRVSDPGQQAALLGLAVAHLVELRYPRGSSPASQGLQGRVTSASEGSVSVSLDLGTTSTLKQAWWAQTPYGSQLWASTGRLRTFRYVPGYPRRRPLLDATP